MRHAMHSAYAPRMQDAYASLQCIRAMHVRTYALTKIFCYANRYSCGLIARRGYEIFRSDERQIDG